LEINHGALYNGIWQVHLWIHLHLQNWPRKSGLKTSFWKFQKLSVGWVQSWSLDQLSRACSLNPWNFLRFSSRRWKDLFKLFTTIYRKVIYEAINTFKIEPENGGPSTRFCRLSVGCESWSLDQLHGVRSPNPLTYRGCVSNHWKDLIMLFKYVYNLLIHISISPLKNWSKVACSPFFTAQPWKF